MLKFIFGSCFIALLLVGTFLDAAPRKEKANKARKAKAVAELRKAGATVVEHVVEINLSGVRLLDEHLAHIAVLTPVRSLILDNAIITNDGLGCVSSLVNLETLSLENTAITDAALVHLEELHNLRVLNLVGTKVTLAGVSHLREVLPDVKIVFKR